MMEPTEIFRVKAEDETAGCDGGGGGGGGALGHPLVYLRFEGNPSVDCYYCSRRFAKPSYFSDRAPAATS
jgi:uncharacterized Zn-finger protein